MGIPKLSLFPLVCGVHTALGWHVVPILRVKPSGNRVENFSVLSAGKMGEEPATLPGFMLQGLVQTLSNEEDELIDNPGERFTIGGGGYGGGGGSTVGTIKDKVKGNKYFYKNAGTWAADMLNAERAGLQAMHDTNTIRVPRPICGGSGAKGSYAVFEYLNMGGRGSGELMGIQLAQMHRALSPNGKYGFDMDNTIGATEQPNGWMDTWPEFFVERRLRHMLRLCENQGAVFNEKEAVLEKTHKILSAHEAAPSLLHGDLWGGNQGFLSPTGEPVIFDPATYYGDRETDLAMTHLFGGFSQAFYDGYNKEWPLRPGYEKRQTVYNLYHILNHYVLFGGMYASQAQRMMGQVLQM